LLVLLSVISCVLCFSISPYTTLFRSSAVYQYPPVPGTLLLDNLQKALTNEDASFLIGLANSLFVSSVVTVSVVFFSSLAGFAFRSEEHTSELQSRENLVCRLLLEKNK